MLALQDKLNEKILMYVESGPSQPPQDLSDLLGELHSFYYGQMYCVSLASAESLRHLENCFDSSCEFHVGRLVPTDVQVLACPLTCLLHIILEL